MSGEITPPSVGDVLIAAEACGWPAIDLGELEIAAGEEAWREALTPDLAAAVWARWHEPDREDDPDDDQADEAGDG